MTSLVSRSKNRGSLGFVSLSFKNIHRECALPKCRTARLLRKWRACGALKKKKRKKGACVFVCFSVGRFGLKMPSGELQTHSGSAPRPRVWSHTLWATKRMLLSGKPANSLARATRLLTGTHSRVKEALRSGTSNSFLPEQVHGLDEDPHKLFVRGLSPDARFPRGGSKNRVGFLGTCASRGVPNDGSRPHSSWST